MISSDLANFVVHEANGNLPTPNDSGVVACRLVLLYVCVVLPTAIDRRSPKQKNNNSNILYLCTVH